MIVWRCHQLLSGLLPKDNLLRVSHQSRLSANDKGDNEAKLGCVHRSPGIYATSKEKLRKTSGRRSSDEDCMTSRFKFGPLPPNEVDRIVQHVKEGKEGKKERLLSR